MKEAGSGYETRPARARARAWPRKECFYCHMTGHPKTCNEAVRGDMGLDTLQSRRDRAKLKWWYKLASLPEDRYPKQLFNQEWNIKPRRGRQRKVWSRMVDDLFKSLDIDKSEWLEDIKHGDSSSASFMASVEECISERESRKFEEGLNTKVKLGMYKRFGKSVEFKKYLHGICDAGLQRRKIIFNRGAPISRARRACV